MADFLNEGRSFPDLVVIDGGTGTVSAPLAAFENLKVAPELIDLAFQA